LLERREERRREGYLFYIVSKRSAQEKLTWPIAYRVVTGNLIPNPASHTGLLHNLKITIHPSAQYSFYTSFMPIVNMSNSIPYKADLPSWT